MSRGSERWSSRTSDRSSPRPGSGWAHVTLLTLGQLGRRQVHGLIDKTAGGATLPDAAIEQIAAKAQGVPLFVEELTRSVVGSGALEERDGRYHLKGGRGSLVIPATLQDSLVARLDRLGPAKDVALAASIIGREFSFDLITAVASIAAPMLAAALDRLVQSDIVAQRGEAPNTIYSFKHVLIRDAAYQTVLKSRKRDLHRRVAQALESQFPDPRSHRAQVDCPSLYPSRRCRTGVGILAQGGRTRLRRPGPSRSDRSHRHGSCAPLGNAGRGGTRRVGVWRS